MARYVLSYSEHARVLREERAARHRAWGRRWKGKLVALLVLVAALWLHQFAAVGLVLMLQLSVPIMRRRRSRHSCLIARDVEVLLGPEQIEVRQGTNSAVLDVAGLETVSLTTTGARLWHATGIGLVLPRRALSEDELRWVEHRIASTTQGSGKWCHSVSDHYLEPAE